MIAAMNSHFISASILACTQCIVVTATTIAGSSGQIHGCHPGGFAIAEKESDA